MQDVCTEEGIRMHIRTYEITVRTCHKSPKLSFADILDLSLLSRVGSRHVRPSHVVVAGWTGELRISKLYRRDIDVNRNDMQEPRSTIDSVIHNTGCGKKYSPKVFFAIS